MSKYSLEQFEPVDGNIIVAPAPDVKIKTLVPDPDVFSPVKKNTDIETIRKIVKKYEKQPTILKVGQVIALPEMLKATLAYKIGDWVVYKDGGMKLRLDLVADKSDDLFCPIIMKHFEVLAKVSINE